MKDVLDTHKRRESRKHGNGWVRPATIRSAFIALRLIDLAIRIFNRLF